MGHMKSQMREWLSFSLLCCNCIAQLADGDTEDELCELQYASSSVVAEVSWADEDRSCSPHSLQVQFRNWKMFNDVNETTCKQWYQHDFLVCTRGLARGPWLQESIKNGLRASPQHTQLLLCLAKVCFNKDYSTYALNSNEITSSTIKSTTPSTFHDEAILEYLERLYNETLQSTAEEYDDIVLLWTIILTSVLFSFFAILAAYESLALILCKSNPTEKSI
ncbi:unnamed protein product [Cylicocyclus nassatus]|uniref:Uncharacterized protein n=1 Tax=Cylicocyclus nassatus TaxID=53992 RepID=A0AA36M0T5_CYLNA|nr:unnamed protein product [Cylicocyclus nassatus]